MDDLISRQAAIDMLKNRWKKTRNYEGIGDDIAEECELNLKQVPSAQPGWIPWDSGRYPDESGLYIVTAYDGNTSRVTFAKYQKKLKRWELTGARAYWKVLAWQPLPTPYREGRQDG